MRMTQLEVDAFNAKHNKPPSAPTDTDAIAAGKEAELHQHIINELHRRRWLYIHSRMDRATTTAKGVPDFTIFKPGGDTLFLEAKTKTGKQSTEQRAFENAAKASGYQYSIVRSLRGAIEEMDK